MNYVYVDGEGKPLDADQLERAAHLRQATIDAATQLERARIRAIVLKFYASDWTANDVLREIDNG